MEGIYNDNLDVAPARAWSLPHVAVTLERAVVAFAVGIALYFAWPSEPVWVFAAVSGAALVVLAWRLDAGIVALSACAVVGFGASALHTKIESPNPLEFEQRLVITGHVVDMDTRGPMRRLTLGVASVDRVPDSGVPKRLRIRVSRNFPQVAVGDTMRVPAVVAPLPGPAVPHGYDPARRAFFMGLAGSGFAIGDPEAVTVELSATERLDAFLMRRRRAIAARVLDSAPEATAGLQAALLTGLRDDIPDAQTEALRQSGLAHILAISGLHMGMVAFGVFSFATAVLALLPIAAARDMRKPAALIAIAAATVYLGLSGASVATQRAYIMVVIAFLAILLDRRALSLRSVAVAAAITLVIHPEALMSVGFQMSFAAVTALVICYREWADRRPRQKAVGMRGRVLSFYGGLAGTSLIAGLATGGFALFHFGRIANYGLLGNLAAMVVFPAVMACGIMALLVLPLGWEGAPLAIMGWLLTFMLWIAEWVAGLPGAVGYVKASHPVALAIYSAGFVMACFATRRSVVGGATLMLTSFVLWWATPAADLRITEGGRVSIRADGIGHTSSVRADSYGRDQFARGAGDPDIVWQAYRDDFAQCDALGCRFKLGKHWISVVEEASQVPEACADSAVVVLPERHAGIVARRKCGAVLLDGRALRETGGVHIHDGPKLRVVPIASEKRARRPWGQGR